MNTVAGWSLDPSTLQLRDCCLYRLSYRSSIVNNAARMFDELKVIFWNFSGLAIMFLCLTTVLKFNISNIFHIYTNAKETQHSFPFNSVTVVSYQRLTQTWCIGNSKTEWVSVNHNQDDRRLTRIHATIPQHSI